MTRILFVDDEPRVLDGLRQGLRGKRRLWEMHFAEGGAAGLDVIGRLAFDIVVSDMRMPGIDGAELLSRVARAQPQAARIILSGQMAEAAAARAAVIAHRFLAKPCSPEALEATLTRTLELQSMLASEDLRKRICGIATLPALPRSCAALNDALANDRVQVQDIAAIIESDAGMASKVLQLVNSSFFGLSRTIASVTQAVNYLGLGTVRNLALAHAISHLFEGVGVESFEREQSRSLSTARVARRLLSDERSSQAAATAALLRDVGSLALASRAPDQHREIISHARTRGVPVHEVEREWLGTTHADVGAYLLGLWGLPHDVLEAVMGHHGDRTQLTALNVTAAVQAADSLTASVFLSPAEADLYGASWAPEWLSSLGLMARLEPFQHELRDNLSAQPGTC